MDSTLAHIGKTLKDKRIRAGMTQHELAGASGLTQTTIARIESDRVEPAVRTLRKLAAALEITISDLLD
jgi:transcriptional regulator with XRE-family HTH domain